MMKNKKNTKKKPIKINSRVFLLFFSFWYSKEGKKKTKKLFIYYFFVLLLLLLLFLVYIKVSVDRCFLNENIPRLYKQTLIYREILYVYYTAYSILEGDE